MDDLFDTATHPGTEAAEPERARPGQPVRVFDIAVQGVREAGWRELFQGFDQLKALTFSASVPAILDVASLFQDVEITFGSERVLSRELAALEQVTAATGYRFIDALADQKAFIERFVRPALSQVRHPPPGAGREGQPALSPAARGTVPCQALSPGRPWPLSRHRGLGQSQPRRLLRPPGRDLPRRRW
jgi:hypothetical protein